MTQPPSPPLGKAIRHEWLLEQGMDFLNHGSFGATPRRVLASQDRWRLRMERQPLRFFIDVLPDALREAADDLGQLLGSSGEDLAFVSNATSGVNAVLRSIPFEPGDQILTTNHVYGAVAKTIEYVARRCGAEPVFVDVPFPPSGPDEVIELVAEALTDRTRLAVLDHITSATALVLPIERLVALCRERGVPVLVDGAHAPGMVDMDLGVIGANWYTGNCHKWLCSAKGCAFLWSNPSSEGARRDLHPPVISHFLDQDWPLEFDFVGTGDYTPFLSLPEALAFHRELGPSRARGYIHDLALEAGQLICESWGVENQVPHEMTGSILTLRLPRQLPACPDEAVALTRAVWKEHRIEVPMVPFGDRMWLRISAQVYNELDDYRALARVLRP